MNNIINYLDELFPNPKCELEYSKDYELLIAVMLSAQTTDKRVNMVTDILFKKYDSLNESVQENVSGIRVVKAFAREDYEINNVWSTWFRKRNLGKKHCKKLTFFNA